MKKRFILYALSSLLAANVSWGSVTGGAGLPWETPLQTVKASVAGPVAGALAVILLVTVAITFWHRGDWGEVGQKFTLAIFVIAIMGLASATLLVLFPQMAGAVIG